MEHPQVRHYDIWQSIPSDQCMSRLAVRGVEYTVTFPFENRPQHETSAGVIVDGHDRSQLAASSPINAAIDPMSERMHRNV